jgi:hypothetical protein
MLTSRSRFLAQLFHFLYIYFFLSINHLAPLYLCKTEVFVVPSTNGPSGRNCRLSAVSSVRRWRRGYRRMCRRVTDLLGFRIRVQVPIRVRNRVLSMMMAAARRATAAAAAGPVVAARSAAAPLPRPFSWQAQGLARQTPALLAC